MVDAFSLEALERSDRARAYQQSQHQVRPGGALGGQGGSPRPTRYLYPSVTGNFSASRQKQSELLAPTPNTIVFLFDLFTPQVSVSYTPDVFGLNRRMVESAKAQEDQQRYTLIATHITLSANLVSAAIQEASLREQIDATRRLVDLNSRSLGNPARQFSQGYASRLDVAAQESQLAQIEATLPPLLKQLAQQRDLLAVLLGVFPSHNL